MLFRNQSQEIRDLQLKILELEKRHQIFLGYSAQVSRRVVLPSDYSKINLSLIPSWYCRPKLGDLNFPHSFPISRKISKRKEDLSIDELVVLLEKHSQESDEYKKIIALINRKRFAEWLSLSIKKLRKALRKLLKATKFRLQNQRDFFRSIYSFNFKNLDDYHASSLFNHFFTIYELNKVNHEKKYYY